MYKVFEIKNTWIKWRNTYIDFSKVCYLVDEMGKDLSTETMHGYATMLTLNESKPSVLYKIISGLGSKKGVQFVPPYTPKPRKAEDVSALERNTLADQIESISSFSSLEDHSNVNSISAIESKSDDTKTRLDDSDWQKIYRIMVSEIEEFSLTMYNAENNCYSRMKGNRAKMRLAKYLYKAIRKIHWT
jgi:hypothetical protein